MSGGGLVEGALEPRGERGRRRRVRTRLSRGRHLPASHLAEHALQHVGVVARLGEIDRAQRDAGRFQRVIVTAHAILIDERPRRFEGGRRRARRLPVGAGRRRKNRKNKDEDKNENIDAHASKTRIRLLLARSAQDCELGLNKLFDPGPAL